MSFFKSSNPVISYKVFDKAALQSDHSMTVEGTYNKFGILFIGVLLSAALSWTLYYQGVNPMPMAMGASLVGFVIAIVLVFKQTWAPVLAPAYALFKGFALGAISALANDAFAESYPGLVMQAVLLTLGVAGGMYGLYRSGAVRATPTFKKIVMGATLGIFVFYLIAFVLRLCGVQMPYLHDNSLIGIGISLFIVAIAALNLVLDFDMIDEGAAQGAPKYFEWYAAFGLVVTLVWLYLEILRLLMKLSSRD